MITSKFKKVIAIDTSKHTFNICVRDLTTNKETFSKVKRDSFVSKVVQLATEGSVIVMESCGGSHYWARTFQKVNLAVRLIAPQHARKFLPNRRMKNDTNDAIAICRCAVQPETNFVRVKTEEESAILCTHKQRQTVISLRVAAENRIRAMLSESGKIFPVGMSGVTEMLEYVDSEEITKDMVEEKVINLRDEVEHYRYQCQREKRLNDQIIAFSKNNELVKLAQGCPGVGPLTASAVVGQFGDCSQFNNAREMAAMVGLTPSQNSTGGRNNLGSISKNGNNYLRSLLTMGAESIIRHYKKRMEAQKSTQLDLFACRLELRGKHKRKIIIAVAARLARTLWAMLTHKEAFKNTREQAEQN
jgi:transposase